MNKIKKNKWENVRFARNIQMHQIWVRVRIHLSKLSENQRSEPRNWQKYCHYLWLYIIIDNTLINAWNLSALQPMKMNTRLPMLLLLISKRQTPGFNYFTTKKGQTHKLICIKTSIENHIWGLDKGGQKKNAYLKAAEENSLKVWTEHWGSYFS